MPTSSAHFLKRMESLLGRMEVLLKEYSDAGLRPVEMDKQHPGGLRVAWRRPRPARSHRLGPSQ